MFRRTVTAVWDWLTAWYQAKWDARMTHLYRQWRMRQRRQQEKTTATAWISVTIKR